MKIVNINNLTSQTNYEPLAVVIRPHQGRGLKSNSLSFGMDDKVRTWVLLQVGIFLQNVTPTARRESLMASPPFLVDSQLILTLSTPLDCFICSYISSIYRYFNTVVVNIMKFRAQQASVYL